MIVSNWLIGLAANAAWALLPYDMLHGYTNCAARSVCELPATARFICRCVGLQGYTAHLHSDNEAGSQAPAASILGMPYAAVSSPQELVVGSTKCELDSAADAAAVLQPAAKDLTPAGTAAALQLQADLAETWPAVQGWSTGTVRH